jgi:hypothetical protein
MAICLGTMSSLPTDSQGSCGSAGRRRANSFLSMGECGQQFVLNRVPSLHDQLASGGIHFAGVMVLASITTSCQKWPPAPSAFASRRKKSGTQSVFCKRLLREIFGLALMLAHRLQFVAERWTQPVNVREAVF